LSRLHLKNYIWKWVAALMLICCVNSLWAQTDLEKQVMGLFDTPITWLHNYEGILDEAHPVQMCLAFDGFNCRGYIQYPENDTPYLLEGSLQSSEFVFLEKYKDRPSGYINGKLLGDEIKLQWTSIDDTHSFDANFEKMSPLVNKEEIDVTAKGVLNVHKKSAFLNHQTMMKMDIPTLDETFDNQMALLLMDWNQEIKRYQKKPSQNRFANKAEIWFDIKELSDKYFSGFVYMTSSWGEKINTISFSYDRKHEKLIKTNSFFKSKEKWEASIKERMMQIAQKSESKIDNERYANWIQNNALLGPVVCDLGIKISSQKSTIFGQIEVLKPWKSLTSDFISPSKLNKLKRQ